MSHTARYQLPQHQSVERCLTTDVWCSGRICDAIRIASPLVVRCRKYGLSAVLFFLIVVGLQCRSGAFEAGFGSHPDEAGHYVTGLMVYKYLTTSITTSPMAFAERFYAHYPAVAFGHWPPLFYILQAAWGFIFGLSRTSALLLIAVMTSLISTVLYHTIRTRLGWSYGVVCAALFPLLPIVQQHTSSIMAEVPLTLVTFATAITFTRLCLSPTDARAFWFGLCLCSTIWMKGNGWALMLIPFVALLLTRSLSSLRKTYFWVPMLFVLACCSPMTWATMKMTKDGWAQQSLSFPFFCRALPTLLGFHLAIIGLPLLILACIGLFGTVIRPLLNGGALHALWASNVAVIVSVLMFHAVVPTSMEPRKIFMSIPSLLVFAAAGLKCTLEFLHRLFPALTVNICTPFWVGALMACWYLIQPYSDQHANMGLIAQRLISEKKLDRSAVLVASTELDERAELSFVAEVADRENGSFRHAVIRAGKFVADSSWLGSDYKLRYTDAAQASAALDAIPISAIALYTREGLSNPHGALIKQVVGLHGAWLCIHSERAGPEKIQLWSARCSSTKAVRLPQLDLKRKLGRDISAEF